MWSSLSFVERIVFGILILIVTLTIGSNVGGYTKATFDKTNSEIANATRR
jgi:hypothetical protein